jgi:amino-acid N-acetyltransferase
MSDVSIGPLSEDEIAAVYSLLRAVSLPVQGLDAHVDTILVARRDEEVVGTVALEAYEDGALLRSLAVAESERGKGLGIELTQAAIALARARGMPVLVLLTETAAEFFPKFGFETVSRAEVPVGVRRSVEFTTVCPESAVVQALTL